MSPPARPPGPPPAAVRVAVVDDSSFVRRALERMLAAEPRVRVVGTAASGEELLARVTSWRPEVITLDLAMPGIGGLATLDRLAVERPTPVIVLSTHSGRGAPQTIEALHRGAVDFIDKQQYSLMDFDSLRRVLVEKILQVHRGGAVVREDRVREDQLREDPGRGRAAATAAAATGEAEAAERGPGHLERDPGHFDLLVVGASTGGPPAVQRILEDLGPRLPVPVAVAQHMPGGFTRAFAARLNSHLPFRVQEADGGLLRPGTVYVAPAGGHLVLRARGAGIQGRVVPNEPPQAFTPSVDRLFQSAREVRGERVLAVLLTGMGRDGARGLAALRQAGAYTLVQDEATSVVFGMPGAAVRLGAPRAVLPLAEIGPRVRGLLVGETS